MIRRAPFVTFQFLVVTAVAGCSDDGGGGGDGRSIFNRADGGATVTNSREVDAEDYCELVCKVADDCDKNFDKQTCSHRCGNQASSIVKLNPSVQSELYECFEDSTCKVVNAESFVAGCLGEAVEDLKATKAGKDFCNELSEAADDCKFSDYDEDVCLQATLAFADDVLASARTCAGKKCSLVVECLDATFTLPGEIDGTTVGLDAKGRVTSGSTTQPTVVALLPKTAGSLPISPVNPDVSPTGLPDASATVEPDPTGVTTYDPTDSTDTDEPAPTDTSSEPRPTDSTSTEPVPTNTTSSSEPVPTSEDETDSSDPTDTTEVDTSDVDTTDTTEPDPEACAACQFDVCYTEVQACAYDPEGEITTLYTCAELDAVLYECSQLYGSPDQEAQWDACYYEALENTTDTSFALLDAYVTCYSSARNDACVEVCE